jgi:cellulose synthase/poly-beta-1,6-N-acetylglucosamine synthase-like glycosyltransferase
VIFEPDSLRLLTRHLADGRVGAVTAYIKEGSRPGNYLTRFIGYEYVTAQAAARRAQNVLGVLACLAGGAQLHTRANLVALGGRIDTSSLAEDTVTTFETQLNGRRVVFEPHATVWAEEPGTLTGLWKQRLRWARGNVQVTRRYWRLWFRPSRRHGLGGVSFGLFWFCLFLQPVFMIVSSAALLALYFGGLGRVWLAFHLLWIINAATYGFITVFALLIDPATGRRCWRQAIMFPGLINLAIIVYSCFPRPFAPAVHGAPSWLIVGVYAWLTLSMGAAWLAKALEPCRVGRLRVGRLLSPVLVYLAGYGSVLCACTFTSYLLELRRAEARWEKTEKTGKAVVPT